MNETSDRPRRTWCYVMPPASFEMAPCSCGNADTQWSEFQKHLWCAKCEKDFIPEHAGVFDGPICTGAAELIGLSFDRVILATGEYEQFNRDTATWEMTEQNPAKPTT